MLEVCCEDAVECEPRVREGDTWGSEGAVIGLSSRLTLQLSMPLLLGRGMRVDIVVLFGHTLGAEDAAIPIRGRLVHGLQF